MTYNRNAILRLEWKPADRTHVKCEFELDEDSSLDQILECVKTFLIGMSYSPKLIDDCIVIDE